MQRLADLHANAGDALGIVAERPGELQRACRPCQKPRNGGGPPCDPEGFAADRPNPEEGTGLRVPV